jgi:hypothetical protein
MLSRVAPWRIPNVDTGGEFGGALIGAAVRLFSGADERREEEPNVVAPG